MIDIKQYLDETNTVLLTKEVFEYLKEKASALDKIRDEIEREADYQDANVNADVAKGMYMALETIDKYTK